MASRVKDQSTAAVQESVPELVPHGVPADTAARSGEAPDNSNGSSTEITASLADKAFDLLREWIINGQFHPGYTLRVREVATMVGTSVMPVREAISRLVDSGLAVQEPYKSARVRGLSVEELEETYAARILIEGECARLGSLAATPDLVSRMESKWVSLQEAVKAGNIRAAMSYDEQLLDELYAAGGNEVLRGIIRTLWDRSMPYKVLWVQAAGLNISFWQYKPDLIDAVRTRNGEAAQDVIRVSYQKALDSIRIMLRTQNIPGAARVPRL